MSIMSLKLSKDEFKFSAAHFLIFDENSAERLHGHNYQVELELSFDDSEKLEKKSQELSGGLGYLIDFKKIKKILKETLKELDEYVLIPAKHPDVRIVKKSPSLEVFFRERYYVFPETEVKLLPIDNTSVEEFARLLTNELIKKINHPKLINIQISVAETRGQAAQFQHKIK